jgi:hypothetical protein
MTATETKPDPDCSRPKKACWDMTEEQVRAKAAKVAEYFAALSQGRTWQHYWGDRGWCDEPLNCAGPSLLSDLDFWRIKPNKEKP